MAGTHPEPALLISHMRLPLSYVEVMQAFADFETKITAFTSVDSAKVLSNAMRGIFLQHHTTSELVERHRQEIPGMVSRMRNAAAADLYDEFSKVWNEGEERETHQLPLLDGKRDNDGGVLSHEVQNGRSFESSGMRRSYYANSTSMEMTQAPASPQSNTSRLATDGDSPSLSLRSVPTYENEQDDTRTLLPINNPEAFPVARIQEVQAEYYPSAYISSMWLHLNATNQPIQVTADLEDGPVNCLLIRDSRIITSLGLSICSPPSADINMQSSNRVDETYTIRLLPGYGYGDPRHPNAWVFGELVSARHAYLYWLEARGCADPKGGPTAAEAKDIARRTRRRAWDVMREIEAYWGMENGPGGQRFRQQRAVLLGEDPVFPGDGERRQQRCMWV